MAIALRKLQASDRPAYRRVRLEALRNFAASFGSSFEEQSQLATLPFEGHLADIARPAFVLGAFDGAKLVGSCVFGPAIRLKNRHWGELPQVYVRPTPAGQGLGRRVGQAAVDEASARPGVEQITLGVIADNVAANRLYEGLGFRQYGLLDNYLCIDGRSLAQRFMVLTRPAARVTE